MRFLFLNCYDPDNPRSGGAEKFTKNIAKRLISDGHEVDWISSDFKGKKNKRSKINYIRYGNRISVVFYALFYLLRNRKQYDFVIDQFHAYPFFTPLLVPSKKSLTIIHEVAGDIWNYMTPFPLNIFGKNLERFLLRTVYRNRVFLTVSNSTRDELVLNGLKKSRIFVLKQGVDKSFQNIRESEVNSNKIIYLGGIRNMKRIEDQIKAIGIISGDFPKVRLYITGKKEGSYYEKLLKLVKTLKVEDNVTFTGYLTKKKLAELMLDAYLTFGTSVKEGWGLAISEAGAVGIPAVCYNVPGYRDSIKHLKTGILTYQNNPETLAEMTVKLFNDEELWQNMRKNCLIESKNYDWEETYQGFLEALDQLPKIFTKNKQSGSISHYAF